jgi:hypothetical protein
VETFEQRRRPIGDFERRVPALARTNLPTGLETRAGLRHDYAAGASAFAGAGMKYVGI